MDKGIFQREDNQIWKVPVRNWTSTLYSTLQLYLALNTFCYEPYSHIPAALYSIPLSAFDEAQSHPNASIRSNLELSILPEDTSDCGLEELGSNH